MSRYVIWTDNQNLEVTTGFDEGFQNFFLTIGDTQTCTEEAGGYLFHNIDHHPELGMTLDEVRTTLARFGIVMPVDLVLQLSRDARVGAVTVGDGTRARREDSLTEQTSWLSSNRITPPRSEVRVLSWESAL